MSSLLHWFWGNGVYYLLYLLLIIVGLITSKVIVQTPLSEKLNQWQYRYRLRKIRSEGTVAKKIQYRNPALRHLYLLIKTTSSEKSDNNVAWFVAITVLLFLFSGFITVFKFHDVLFGLVIGLLVGSIPYLLLQIKLRKLRFLMGEEFISILQALTQNYNAASYDMYHALVETQKSIENRTLRKIFVRLVSDLQVSRNEDELRLSVNVFVFTAGTSWSKRLGNIIIKSYLNNENVLKTLLVLTRQIEETAEMLEQEKSHTMDNVLNGYLTIPIYIMSLFLGYFVSGAQDWFNLQFGNQWTLTTFTLSTVGVVFSIIIAMMLKRPKNDI